MVTILHISDLHFGSSDLKGELPAISRALLRAARAQAWTPDVCVFSGDLAFSGTAAEFELGRKWLCDLLATPWNSRLFIVPGNHDVNRSKANIVLLQAGKSEAAFAKSKPALMRNAEHLDGFRKLHQELKSLLADRLLSDWTDVFGTYGSFTTESGPTIHLVGLNTSLLSCGDDDEGRLVQDLATLHERLERRTNEFDCAIAVGHHPTSWLAGWNGGEVLKLLQQQNGAHLYLHGHQHVQNTTAFSAATGASLATLESGAAYQGSQWPQYFCLYRLDFSLREISTRTFVYSPNAGEWVIDNALSFSFVAPLPRPAPRPPVVEAPRPPQPAGPAAGPGATAEAVTSPTTMDLLELEAYRAREVATAAKRIVEVFLNSEPSFTGGEFNRTARIKERDAIIDKVLRRRSAGNTAYSVEDVTDICGFRYVTLFQSGVPLLVERFLRLVAPFGPATSPLRLQKAAIVTIHTSRRDGDPLAITSVVRDVVERWGGPAEVEVRAIPTGYSSVHVVVHCVVQGNDGTERLFPVEIQIRSALEEIWGQVDHRLRYGSGRGAVAGANWQLHLNGLKAQIDAVIQYMDLIKQQHDERLAQTDRPPLTTSSTKPVDPPQKELERLNNLPAGLMRQVEQAYALWKRADASRQFGGDSGAYRKAADAFSPLMDGQPGQVKDRDLSDRLSYTARMERAYLLAFTSDPDDLEEAHKIYLSVTTDRPEDAAAHFRIGWLLRRRGQIEPAIRSLTKAIQIIESQGDWRIKPKVSWVYDAARLNLALSHFRVFERQKTNNGDRRRSIKEAITLAKAVLDGATDNGVHMEAVNALLYYAWEERYAFADTKTWDVTENEFKQLTIQLMELVNSDSVSHYTVHDTLARSYAYLGEMTEAQKHAKKVCEWLEKAALQRSNGELGSGQQRYSFAWMAKLMAYLKAEDEKDALAYCLDLIPNRASSPSL